MAAVAALAVAVSAAAAFPAAAAAVAAVPGNSDLCPIETTQRNFHTLILGMACNGKSHAVAGPSLSF